MVGFHLPHCCAPIISSLLRLKRHHSFHCSCHLFTCFTFIHFLMRKVVSQSHYQISTLSASLDYYIALPRLSVDRRLRLIINLVGQLTTGPCNVIYFLKEPFHLTMEYRYFLKVMTKAYVILKFCSDYIYAKPKS